MKWRSTRMGRWLFVTAAAAGCGDPFTLVGSGGAASTTSTKSEEDGTGGSSTSQSSAGGGGSAGSAPECVPGAIGACSEGSYCKKPTSTCVSCADLGRFHFAPPIPIQTTPSTAGTTAFYPRVGEGDGTLYFVYIDDSGALPRSRIAAAPYQPAKGASGTWSFMHAPIASSTEEGAPLYLPSGAMLDGLVDGSSVDVEKPVLLFDSTRNGATTRKIFAANLDGANASLVSLPSGKRDLDVAAAPESSPPRFYWMSNGITGLEPRLVTATGASAQMVAVKLALDTGCVIDAVRGPWVDPKGSVLLFAASPPAAGTCAPVVPSRERVYAARMTSDGQQVTGDMAKPLFPDDVASFDSTPSLSADGCFLLFSRFDPMTNDGRPMYAVRD